MTISEVSKKYNIPVDTLRYYERIGLLQNIQRKSSGLRDYSEENCKMVSFIKHMRNAGVSIEVLKKYMELYSQGNSTHNARKELLIEQREILINKLSDLQATIERLNYKIENYDNISSFQNGISSDKNNN